jgi:hypothetical protein
MADILEMIPQKVLASALRDITGVEYDLSTHEGELKAAEVITEILQSHASLNKLLEAIEQHGGEKYLTCTLPERFGPVAMADDAIQADKTWDMPPVGSKEFDDYIETQLATDKTLESLELHLVVLEKVLRETQFKLKQRAAQERKTFMTRFVAMFKAMSNTTSPLFYSTKNYPGFTIVEARQGGNMKLKMKSSFARAGVIVEVVIDGKVALKDKISSVYSTQEVTRLTEVFAKDAEAGAEVIHQLRDANANFLYEYGHHRLH